MIALRARGQQREAHRCLLSALPGRPNHSAVRIFCRPLGGIHYEIGNPTVRPKSRHRSRAIGLTGNRKRPRSKTGRTDEATPTSARTPPARSGSAVRTRALLLARPGCCRPGDRARRGGARMPGPCIRSGADRSPGRTDHPEGERRIDAAQGLAKQSCNPSARKQGGPATRRFQAARASSSYLSETCERHLGRHRPGSGADATSGRR